MLISFVVIYYNKDPTQARGRIIHSEGQNIAHVYSLEGFNVMDPPLQRGIDEPE
jgi:hypothetical protein